MAYVYATTEQVAIRLGKSPTGPDIARVAAVRDLSEVFLAKHLDAATSEVPAAIVLEAHLRIAVTEWEKSQSVAGNPPNALSDPGSGVQSPIYYSKDVLNPVRAFLGPWVPDIGFGAADPTPAEVDVP